MRIQSTTKKADISWRGPSWLGISEGKKGRKAGSSQAGLYLRSTGNVRSTEEHRTCQERSGKAAQALEHRSIEEKKSI